MARLVGKVAVVLGASDERSMGFATARRFLEEGAQVVMAARRGEEVRALAGTIGATGVACDITDEASLEALFRTTTAHHGAVHIAVNFAGIEIAGPIIDIEADALRRSSEVHFVGALLFIKHASRAMTAGGSIVLTSSLTVLAQAPMYAAYAGAKGGADVAMRIAANELGEKGIRVNAIAPGFTRSAMTDAHFENEAILKAFRKELPLGRFVTVSDIAETAVWLASDEALVTGQRLDVTGGQSLRRVPLPVDFG